MQGHYSHTCNTERASYTADEYMNQQPTWASQLVGQACRYSEKEEKLVKSEQAEIVYISAPKLFFPAGTDIKEGDRVAGITFEDGSSLAKVYIIEALAVRRRTAGPAFISCRLREAV